MPPLQQPQDNAPMPYNNAQLAAMKEDIANRAFRIKMIGMVVTALFAVGAIAAMFFMPGLAAGGAAFGKLAITGGLALGGAVTSMITMREAKKLELDEQYLQSYMSGKNYWGAGYRQEVAEYGYGAPPLGMQAPPPMGQRGKPNGLQPRGGYER